MERVAGSNLSMLSFLKFVFSLLPLQINKKFGLRNPGNYPQIPKRFFTRRCRCTSVSKRSRRLLAFELPLPHTICKSQPRRFAGLTLASSKWDTLSRKCLFWHNRTRSSGSQHDLATEGLKRHVPAACRTSWRVTQFGSHSAVLARFRI